nr:uncharacterized protein LOC107396891 isoform X2 [Nothobranchius furzeri]
MCENKVTVVIYSHHVFLFPKDVHQRVKEEASEDQSAGVDQQDSEKFHIKEEQEELRTSLEGEQLHLKEETNPARFPVTPVSIKSGLVEDQLGEPIPPLDFHTEHQQKHIRSSLEVL